MGSGDGIKVKRGGCALEKCVAGTASGGFEREMEKSGEGRDILSFNCTVEAELSRKITREAGVGVGVSSAQAVIEVENEKHDAEAGREFGKGAQECDGIGSATDGHTDSLAGMDESMLAHVVFE